MKLNNNTINIEDTKYYFTTKTESNYKQFDVNYDSLYECYNNFSSDKESAFNYCKGLLSALSNCKSIEVINYGISSYNIFQFTYVINAMFKGRLISFYITRDNNKIISDKATIKLLLETLNRAKNYYGNDMYILY